MKRLNLLDNFFIFLLFITCFDGIFRAIGVKTGLSIIGSYKEILFGILYLLYFVSFMTGRIAIKLPAKFLFYLKLFVVCIILSIINGILRGHYQSQYIIFLWGLKTSFYYSLPILFLFRNEAFLNAFMEKLIFFLGIALVPIVFFAVCQYVGGMDFLRTIDYPIDSTVIQFHDPELYRGILRPAGTFRAADDLGMFCLFVLSYALFKTPRNYFVILLSVLGVIISTSKFSIMGLFILVLYYVLIMRKWTELANKIKYVMPAILFVAVTFFAPLLSVLFSKIFVVYQSAAAASSAMERLMIWSKLFKDAINNFGITDYVFGKGYGLYGVGLNIIGLVNEGTVYEGVGGIADNNYVMFLLGVGILGFTVLYFWLRLISNEYVKALRDNKSWVLRGSYLYFLLILYAAFFIDVIEAFPYQIYVILVMLPPFVYNDQKVARIS